MKTYKFKINGKDYQVRVEDTGTGKLDVEAGGVRYKVELEKSETPRVRPADKPHREEQPIAQKPATQKSRESSNAANRIKSPLPGTVLDVNVSVGDSVKEGQKLLVLEAMKMENAIEADAAGIVKEINVRKGDAVLEGDVLIVLSE